MVQIHPDEGEAPIIVSLAEAAMHMYVSAIDSLPDDHDPEFAHRVEIILSGLRKLQFSLTEAAGRSRSTPAVIVALSEVRHQYDDLMSRAAAAPGSTLGQQLYVVRRRARISAQEAANGVGLRADLLDNLESGEIPTEDEAVRVKQLIEALGGSSDLAAAMFHHRPDPESFDESMAWNGNDGG